MSRENRRIAAAMVAWCAGVLALFFVLEPWGRRNYERELRLEEMEP